MTQVINLFAGPGAGKSTTAAGVYHQLKLNGKNAELVTEFAKELTWDEATATLRWQLLLLAEQDRRMRRLVGKVDYIITDSPLPLCAIYATTPPYNGRWFEHTAWELFDSYDNINIMLERSKPYHAVGRNQTEVEAIALDRRIREMLDREGVEYVSMPGDHFAAQFIAGGIH